MSAAQKVQQHPVFIQAQNKVNYHLGQLDKEVRIPSSIASLPILTTLFRRTAHKVRSVEHV